VREKTSGGFAYEMFVHRVSQHNMEGTYDFTISMEFSEVGDMAARLLLAAAAKDEVRLQLAKMLKPFRKSLLGLAALAHGYVPPRNAGKAELPRPKKILNE
jgi:hypothetical protein